MRDVLIVDDNGPFAENLAEILEDAGVNAHVATGGREALERVAGHRYDVVLSDMKMPAMGGAELLRRIRAIDGGLPAILITAYTNDDDDMQVARREGLLAILPKPAPIQMLLELVRAARRDGLVAVVEDDLAFSDNLAEAMRRVGFTTVTAASVTETERFHGLRPFVAVVDLRIPGAADGEAMGRLALAFPDMPLVVSTAFSRSVPAGARAVLEKPFPTTKLLAVLEQLYSDRHGR